MPDKQPKREIKFRAYDTFNERMVDEPYYFRPNDNEKNEDDRFNSPFEFAEHWQDVDDGIWRPCFIMQFTGLLDKNGKEIYEGDIIQLEDVICPITFEDGSFMMITDENAGRSNAVQDRTKRFEIIGNIYQNSDLLTPP